MNRYKVKLYNPFKILYKILLFCKENTQVKFCYTDLIDCTIEQTITFTITLLKIRNSKL